MGLAEGFLKRFKKNGNKRFLVIARVGDKSRHKEWLEPNKYKNFDLLLQYYGDGSNDFRKDCEYYSEGKDTKWPNIYKLIKENKNLIFSYDAIWIPDDDISTNCYNINNMFKVFTAYQLSLAQPALTRNSYFSHKITLKRPRFLLRFTQFVEVMAPIFSTKALQTCWPTFKESKSGWGLDSIWPKILGHPNYKIAIIDQTPVFHTRPVGGGTLYKDIDCSPYDELHRLCREYQVKKPFDFKLYGVVRRKNPKIK